MGEPQWTVGRLLEMSGSYWQAFALHSGVRLGVFTLLGERELSAESIAAEMDADVRATTALMNALAAMGLVLKTKGRYRNSPESASFLVAQSPHYVGHMILHHHYLVESWSKLHKAVKSGRPVRRGRERDGRELESFIMGMFNLAMGIAPDVVKQVDLSGRSHLLDLGGGPGTYAIHFCLHNPDLRATVYDRATTAPFAKKTISQFGLGERIAYESGDYLVDPLEGAYDVAWLSHILHAEGPGACRLIIQKAVSALEAGGLLLVHDFILNNTGDGPLFPALFSLNMLVNTPEGQSYSEQEIRDMMAEAGLIKIRRLPFKGPTESGILAGQCP